MYTMTRRNIIMASSLLVAVLAAGGGWLLVRHAQPSPVPTTTAKDVVIKTLDHPSQTKLTTNNYHSTAAPNEPSYISLPSIGVKGYIEKVGIDQYGQMAAPTNVNLAGWYINSLLPGQAGLSIIDGHIDGYQHNQGIFGHLDQLKAGATFTITFGNDSSKSFQVKSVQLVATANVPNVLFAHDPAIPSQLNLITCGGTYDAVSHTYAQRTIVISALIP
ncbi:MAG TPA: class F sortase [Candidatus Saccharimonadales bacterium]|nr:class F sortase [Candidatus Saccharimonadales bacterium]